MFMNQSSGVVGVTAWQRQQMSRQPRWRPSQPPMRESTSLTQRPLTGTSSRRRRYGPGPRVPQAVRHSVPDEASSCGQKRRPAKMKSGRVDVLFANVTYYGEKVRHYVEHCSFDMVGLAEHHLLQKA
eukprot:5589119-Pyramimonas_sp.AAC.1